jgi:hypothetical protein
MSEMITVQGHRNIPERCVCAWAAKATDEAPLVTWRLAERLPACPEHRKDEDKGGSGTP